MIVLIAAVIGALWGARTAQKRGGNRLDILQYAAGFAIAFALVGMLSSVILDRWVI